jgi:hypothetical protein
MNLASTAAHLIEPSAKNILYKNLQKCHEVKSNYFSIWMNLIIFVVFATILGIILYYRYKGAPTAYEKRAKMIRDQQYVLSKIQGYSQARACAQNYDDRRVAAVEGARSAFM